MGQLDYVLLFTLWLVGQVITDLTVLLIQGRAYTSMHDRKETSRAVRMCLCVLMIGMCLYLFLGFLIRSSG